jgi:hypothetical protein
MKSPRAHTIPKRLVRTTKECIEEFIWINLQNQKKNAKGQVNQKFQTISEGPRA